MNTSSSRLSGFSSLLASLLFLLTFAGAAAHAQTAPSADAAIAAPRARVTQAIDENQLVRLHGNVHPMAKPANDRGALSDAQPITRMYLLLQRSGDQELALEQFMADQQNKNSASFHAFVTPQAFGKQFGPADSDIAAVTSWLASHGFQGMKVSNGRTLIEFNGTVGAVRSAFHTDIHQYSVNGETHFANVSDPQIPAALTPVIGGIVGMHNFHPKSFMKRLGTFEHIKATGEIRPAFTYTDSNGTFYGVGPGDFAKIYNIPASATGQGQSIAIVGQSNINLQDVADFRNMFNLAPNVPTVILNGPDPGLVSGDEGESDLDVEWAGAVAQQANIIFVTSETTQTDGEAGVDASAVYIVDNLVAPILSESYGSCEPNLGNGGNEFYTGLWQQAAAEGITVLIAAGDDGPAGCDDPNSENEATGGLAVSGTASTVYNIAVGGTDFNQNAGNFSTYWNAATSPISVESAKSYIPEIPWNDSCGAAGLTTSCATGNTAAQSLFAGSGGPSNCATQDNNGNCTAGNAKPSWQLFPNAPTINDQVRDIPDVSLFASGGTNQSFYIICESDANPTPGGCNLTTSATSADHQFEAVGGTSASTPSFAGIIALVNQKTGQHQGLANPTLYNLAANQKTAGINCAASNPPVATCTYNDVTTGTNDVPCIGGTLNCNNTNGAANEFGVLVSGSNTIAWPATAGYDTATGLGTVNVTNLLNNWAAAEPALASTSLTITGPTNPSSPTFNNNTTFTGTLTKTGGTAVPTGVVILEDTSTNPPTWIDQNNLSASGNSFTITTSFLLAGSYNLVAHYGGDTNYAPSTSSPVAINIAKQSDKVQVGWVSFNATTGAPTVSTGSQNVVYGSSYILRIDVLETSNGNNPCENYLTGVISLVCPTGSVALFSNGSPLNDFPQAQNNNATNTARLNDRGFAEDQPIQLSAGTYAITATYTADAASSFTSSTTSNTLNVTITQAPTTTAVAVNPSVASSGSTVTITALISTTSNGLAPTGTVQFTNNGAAIAGTVTYTGTAFNPTTNQPATLVATITTTVSALPGPVGNDRRPPVPLAPIAILAFAALAYLAFWLSMPPVRRRGYAYAGLAMFLLGAGLIAGCGGGGGGSTGPTGHNETIKAVYSGDTNYTGSNGQTTVTVQ